MSNDGKFYSIVWVVAATIIFIICTTMRGCAADTNKVESEALAKGCSVLHCHDMRTKIFCGQDSAQMHCD